LARSHRDGSDPGTRRRGSLATNQGLTDRSALGPARDRQHDDAVDDSGWARSQQRSRANTSWREDEARHLAWASPVQRQPLVSDRAHRDVARLRRCTR